MVESQKKNTPIRTAEKIYYLIVLFLLAGVLFATWMAQENFPPEFPLYYSLAYGESQLGNISKLVNLSGLIVGISILNILLSAFVIKRKTPARLLLGVTGAWLLMYILGLLFIARRIM